MREAIKPLTAEVEDTAHQLKCGHKQGMEVLVPFIPHHSLIPAMKSIIAKSIRLHTLLLLFMDSILFAEYGIQILSLPEVP